MKHRACEMKTWGRLLPSIIVAMLIVLPVGAYLFFHWFVGIPVRQAVFELTDSEFLRETDRQVAATPDADRPKPKHGNTRERSPFCESAIHTKFINAYHKMEGTWKTRQSRSPDASYCERKCTNDPRCAGYQFQDSGRVCSLVPVGAEQTSRAGVTHMRASATEWAPCAKSTKLVMR